MRLAIGLVIKSDQNLMRRNILTMFGEDRITTNQVRDRTISISKGFRARTPKCVG